MCCISAFATDHDKTDFIHAVLEGKKILFLGDSYTGGRGIEDYSDTWCGMLASEYNMIVDRQSVNGSTLGATPFWGFRVGCSYFPICFRPIPEEDYDVIFVSCGSNDWNVELPIGTDPESRDASCFMGALNILLDRISKEQPDATVILMTPWMTDGRVTSRGETTNDYAMVIKQICFQRRVLCFDVADPTISGIFADSKWFREQYFLTETDPWHLNEEGHSRFLPVAAEWIARLMLTENIFDAGGGPNELTLLNQFIPRKFPYSPWFVAPWFRQN